MEENVKAFYLIRQGVFEIRLDDFFILPETAPE